MKRSRRGAANGTMVLYSHNTLPSRVINRTLFAVAKRRTLTFHFLKADALFSGNNKIGLSLRVTL